MGVFKIRKDRDYRQGAWEKFCMYVKLRLIWEERTAYTWPFACPMFREQNRPYKSFMYEVFRVDDLDAFFNSSNLDEGGEWIKKRIGRQAKYNFHRRDDYLWFRSR